MIGSALLFALAQATPAALEPAGKWTIDYGADCTLSRAFASPDGEVTLGIRPNIMQPGGDLVLVLPGSGGSSRTGAGELTLGPAGKSFRARYARVTVTGKPFHGLTLEPDEAVWASLPDTAEITINAGERSPRRLSVGPMGKALAALRTCQTAQLRFWGADPDAMAELPSGDAWARWFSPSTYPTAAIRRGAKGRSVAMLQIDRQGRVTACRTVRSAGDASLDAAVCGIAVGRARFREAKDGPATRWSPLSVRWWLP